MRHHINDGLDLSSESDEDTRSTKRRPARTPAVAKARTTAPARTPVGKTPAPARTAAVAKTPAPPLTSRPLKVVQQPEMLFDDNNAGQTKKKRPGKKQREREKKKAAKLRKKSLRGQQTAEEEEEEERAAPTPAVHVGGKRKAAPSAEVAAILAEVEAQPRATRRRKYFREQEDVEEEPAPVPEPEAPGPSKPRWLSTAKKPMSDLDLPRLTMKDVDAFMEKYGDSRSLKNFVQINCKLRQYEEELYPLWQAIMRRKMSPLLYGWGSKREVLTRFQMRLSACKLPFFVFRAYLPDCDVALIIRTVVKYILIPRLTEEEINETEPAKLVQMLRDSEKSKRQPLGYVIVHSIDGPNFKTRAAQDLLANLAATNRVQFIASFDHVDTPLLWSVSSAAKFGWRYFHTPTWIPYYTEMAHMPPRGAEGRQEKKVSGAVEVLRSLPKHSREVFRVLADLLREPAFREGVTVNHLFDKSRAKFLVTSINQLRTHLREFTSHALVQMKKGMDGAELLYIDLTNEQLDKVMGAMDLVVNG